MAFNYSGEWDIMSANVRRISYIVKDVGMLNEASLESARPVICPCRPSVHPSKGGDGRGRIGWGKFDGVKNPSENAKDRGRGGTNGCLK